MPLALWREDVEVFRLKVQCVSKAGCFWIRPYRADPAVPPRKAARGAAEADCDDPDSDDIGRSSGSDGKGHGVLTPGTQGGEARKHRFWGGPSLHTPEHPFAR